MSKAPNDHIDPNEEGPQAIRRIFQQHKAEGKDATTMPQPGLLRKIHSEVWQWFLNRKGGDRTKAKNAFDYQVKVCKNQFFPNGE